MSDESVFALQSMQPTSRVALVGVDCSGYHGPFDLWGSPSTVVVSRGSYSAGVKIRDLIKLDSEEDADEFLRSDRDAHREFCANTASPCRRQLLRFGWSTSPNDGGESCTRPADATYRWNTRGQTRAICFGRPGTSTYPAVGERDVGTLDTARTSGEGDPTHWRC